MSTTDPRFEGGQDIRDRSFEFACRVVTFCQELHAAGGIGRLLVPQLVDCSTSFASMLEEAPAAESDRDFVSKYSIGLKEVREAHVRLRICERCRVSRPEETRKLRQEAGELVAITTAIIESKRRNMAAKAERRRIARAPRFGPPTSNS